MKKIFLPIILFICLALSGCGDNKKPEASQPAQQETPTASQQSTSPNEEKPGDKPEETAADTGLGITSDEYQTAYNTHVEQFNTQMKKDPVRMVQLNLKVNGKQFKACTMPYACVDGTMTENGQYINKIAVSGTLTWRDHGLAAGLSMTENMMMKRTGDPAVQDSGWIRGRNARALTWQWLDHYRLSDADGPASSPRCMSRGQRQRAVLGREMDRGTQVLLATLPLTGLNETERRDMISLLMAVRESRRAVILFTTDAEEAMALGDRIVVLRGGEIVGEFHPEAASAREVGLYMTGDRRQGMEDYFDEE